MARSLVQAVLDLDMKTDEFLKTATEFDAYVEKRIGNKLTEAEMMQYLEPNAPAFDPDISDVIDEYDPYEPDSARRDVDDYTPEEMDELIGAEVLLGKGESMTQAKVIGRKRDIDGNPIGTRHPNPILNTRVYEVQFTDGHLEEYAMNTIAENIYSQIDSEGRRFVLMDEIIDHKKDGSAIYGDDAYTTDKRGRKHQRITTKGWKLLVKWKGGLTTWEHLKDLKEANPVEVAEYAVSNKIATEPAFVWWVPTVLKKRDRIIAKVKSKYWSKTHKFGIELPKSVEQALRIDKATGTSFWRLALEKEMTNNKSAFQFIDGEPPPGYKFLKCHMIFDIKMDFTRKVRFVAGGHMTETPASMTYSSVVSRDSVRIAFLVAALNDLEILAIDIQNAYLQAPCREKYYIIAGPEFGTDNIGKKILIVRALYGLKSSGAAWRSHMAQTLVDLKFKSTLADPDVWIRAAIKPDGFKYYEYLLVYVDDILCLTHDPMKVLNTIRQVYPIKDDKIAEPSIYLGATIKKWTIDTPGTEPDIICWSQSARNYLQKAIGEVVTRLDEAGRILRKGSKTPFCPHTYRPEIDTTPPLDEKQHTFYQELIGILRWSIELGRIDIYFEVAKLSHHLCAPRVGHLEQVLNIFAFLKGHLESNVVFDPTEPDIDENRFTHPDWSNFYTDAAEAIPPNMPEPRGRCLTTHCFVDADHAGDKLTRRSHTGVIVFANRAPILWFSKRQNTVETSTFGSEFIAMRMATELIEGLRYKLRMFGIPIEGPTNVFCDNQSVVLNTQLPESMMKKRHNAIAYHRVREAVAAGTMRVAKEDTKTNCADALTKSLPDSQRRELLRSILW